VNTHTMSYQSDPAVAADEAGNLVVVWSSYGQDGSRNGVFARRYDSSGRALDDKEFQVNTHTMSYQSDPAVAADGADNFVVVWSSNEQDGDSWGIFGQRYDSSGTALDKEFQVNTYTSSRQANPAVANDGFGNFVVVWTGCGEGDADYPGGVFGQRFDSSGGAQDPSSW